MKKLLFTLILGSSFGTVFAQNLLTNGSFEIETGATGSYSLTRTAETPDGWGFTPSGSGSGAYAINNVATPYGKWTIAFTASGDPSDSNPAQSSYDSMTQSVQTVAGALYNLSYYLRDDKMFSQNMESFVSNATWNGTVISGTQNSLNVPGTWTLYTATVVGTGTAGGDVLGMNGYAASGLGYLDNVSLVQAQAVPEPNSLTFGGGIVSLAVLRRRKA